MHGIIEATILREVIRRLSGTGGKGAPSQHGYCRHCGQNEQSNHRQVLEVLGSIADRASPQPEQDAGSTASANKGPQA